MALVVARLTPARVDVVAREIAQHPDGVVGHLALAVADGPDQDRDRGLAHHPAAEADAAPLEADPGAWLDNLFARGQLLFAPNDKLEIILSADYSDDEGNGNNYVAGNCNPVTFVCSDEPPTEPEA